MLIGKLWRGVQRFMQDFRIDVDFQRYEREKRADHISAAHRRFDTSPLELEIADIQRTAEAEGSAVYGVQILQRQSYLGAIRPVIDELRTRLGLFTRNYRQEFDQLHEEKMNLLEEKRALSQQMKELQVERSEAREQLSEAFDNLDEAKSSIDSWHAKSQRTPYLFGNGGKRLPKRAVLGQSFGDLDGYKAERERACDAIGAGKSAVADVVARQKNNRSLRDANQAEISRVFEAIRTAEEARQRMFELKNQGVRRHRVEAELAQLMRQETVQQNDLNILTSAMAAFVEQQTYRMGIEERRRAVSELNEKRAQFLSAFDGPDQRSARQQAHREWYLTERERA